MFDEFTTQIDDLTDNVAERSTSLGCLIHGSSKMIFDRKTIKDLDIEERTANGIISQLVKNCAKISADMLIDSKKIAKEGDEVTCDLLIGVTAELDKILWFLESHLSEGPITGKHAKT